MRRNDLRLTDGMVGVIDYAWPSVPEAKEVAAPCNSRPAPAEIHGFCARLERLDLMEE